VIDTGVYTGHPTLAGALLPGFDFVYGDTNTSDDVGHGTHVAGIVHSICPRCSILPVKVLDYYGGDDYTIARGIRYARQRGARIIQISLGGPAPSATMCQAIKAVEAQGAQVVIAAGNSAGNDTWSIGYPALCSPESLVVSATDRYDVPAWFSNYGPTIDLAAPGLAVWSTVPPGFTSSGFLPASGTSMAAPQVSGAAGLLWSAHMGWTAAQVRDRLIATARSISSVPGVDDVYGPRLDVAQAFGLRSRPIAIGMTSDKPWLPRAGTDQERTVQFQAQVRGDVITGVRLEMIVDSQLKQIPMVSQGNGIYTLSYTFPKNTAYWREVYPHVAATNSAGTSLSQEETVVQDGIAPPDATISILNGPPRTNRPAQFMINWAGGWDNFAFSCGTDDSIILYGSIGQVVSCTYHQSGDYYVTAGLYHRDTVKTYTYIAIRVEDNHIYMPLVRGTSGEAR
jgi:subtilisin family serine protease